MGTPDFAVPSLRNLAAEHEIVGVFTQPDRRAGRGRQLQPSAVKAAAQECCPKAPIFQPKSFKRDPESIASLHALEADLVVVAAYGLLLPPAILYAAYGGALNVHASLLPRWRGASPVAHAILHGDAETGVCIMRMDEGLDTGPVVSVGKTEIGPHETRSDLTDRLSVLGAELLLETIPAWMAGEIKAKAQDDSSGSESRSKSSPRYAARLKKTDGRLDWTESALALERRVRAMSPWPGAYCEWQGQKLKVHRAALVSPEQYDRHAPSADSGASSGDSTAPNANPAHPTGNPGEVVGKGQAGPLVQTGEGLLELIEVQAAGKAKVSGRDFMNGRPEFIGTQLDAS